MTKRLLCLITVLCFVFSACSSDGVAEGENRNDTTAHGSNTAADADVYDDTSSAPSSASSENISSDNVSVESTVSGDNSSENVSSKNENATSKEEETTTPPANENPPDTTVGVPERDPEKSELEQWYMVLANPDNPIDKDYIANVKRATINSAYCTKSESAKYLDERVIKSFVQMCKDAKKQGISIYSVSAYRTYEKQETLFKNRVDRVMREENLPKDEATEKAATIVARPGTSEHHLGLAVDINSVKTSFENTKQFKWLQENAENYGFVLRYPKDKQHITKIIYEPWHYRFVGIEHAKEMNRLGLCFEEYIEYLKQNSNNN